MMPFAIRDIKKIVLIALASDDHLMETLVLKGGNAIDLLQLQSSTHLSRASYDFDFSIEDDFDEELEEISKRLEKTLSTTFEENGLIVFDYKFVSRPSKIGEALKNFWGGLLFYIFLPSWISIKKVFFSYWQTAISWRIDAIKESFLRN